MNPRVREILSEIKEREEELEELIQSYEEELFYKIEDGKVKFDKLIEQTHYQLKVDVLTWLRNSSFNNIVSSPIIYGMFFPFLLLDILISLYQLICFRLYKIPVVKRSKYIVIDRHHLKYLNAMEKFNCIYCGYVNGLISYMREIVSRTEQYWCPIKHAKKILDPHRRYVMFASYGDSEDYHQFLKKMRSELSNKH